MEVNIYWEGNNISLGFVKSVIDNLFIIIDGNGRNFPYSHYIKLWFVF